MLRVILLLTLCALPLPGGAVGSSSATSHVSLADLAAGADLVAVAQARDTDYLSRRGIPVSGSAFLRILIAYKLPAGISRPVEIIEVFEKGVHEKACYFPNPSVFEEGRRYLLFVKTDPARQDRYRGMPAGCALEILVQSNNQYALRYPVTGIALSDPLEDWASDMTFSDPYASTDSAALPVQGIHLGDVRKLMFPDGLPD